LVDTLRGYVRDAAVFKNHAGSGLLQAGDCSTIGALRAVGGWPAIATASDENTGPTFVQDVAKSSSTSPPRKYSQLALPRGEDRFILIAITHTLDKQ